MIFLFCMKMGRPDGLHFSSNSVMWLESHNALWLFNSERKIPSNLPFGVWGPGWLEVLGVQYVSHTCSITSSKKHHTSVPLDPTILLPFKWQTIKRIQVRLFCLAHGLKVLNLCILFLLLSQIGLVTRQPKYLISFANSHMRIAAATICHRGCQCKYSPLPMWPPPPRGGQTPHMPSLAAIQAHRQRDGFFGIIYGRNISMICLFRLKSYVFVAS